MMLLGFIILAFVGFLYLMFQMMAIYIVLVLVCALLTTVYFQQNKLLYMPVIPEVPKSPKDNMSGYQHPIDQGLQAQDLELETSDGLTLRGWHVKVQQPQRIIVYFHQNAGNIGYRIPLIRQLSRRTNSNVILVAYRGFSDSDGYATQEGLKIDGQTVVQYALKYSLNQQKPLGVYLYGRSLGGAVSIYVGSSQKYKDRICGLILQNTFTSIGDMIDAIMPVFKYMKFLQRNFWNSLQMIPRIAKPILFIRCLRDEIVPTAQMSRLIKNSGVQNYIEEYQIPNGTHNCSWQLQKDVYFERVNKFLGHAKVK